MYEEETLCSLGTTLQQMERLVSTFEDCDMSISSIKENVEPTEHFTYKELSPSQIHAPLEEWPKEDVCMSSLCAELSKKQSPIAPRRIHVNPTLKSSLMVSNQEMLDVLEAELTFSEWLMQLPTDKQSPKSQCPSLRRSFDTIEEFANWQDVELTDEKS